MCNSSRLTKGYFDNNSTTMVPPSILQTYLKWVNCGNASNTNHAPGRAAAAAIARSKRGIAKILSASESEIYFTACASEANNIILQGVTRKRTSSTNDTVHIACSSVEHKCVLKTCEELAGCTPDKVSFSSIPANKFGEITVDAVAAVIRPETVLVSVMYANNEIGNVNPIGDIGRLIQKLNESRPADQKIHFHVDAVAAIARRVIHPRKLRVHSMSISAHKFHGVKGIGVLYISRGTADNIQPLTYGGGQGYVRSGTDNTPAIVSTFAALALVQRSRLYKNRLLDTKRRDILKTFAAGLLKTPYTCYVYGPPPSQKKHIQSTILITFIHKNKNKDVCNKKLVEYLDKHKICVSIGSSCNTKDPKASHVLYAIGAGDSHQKKSGTIRITMSDYTTAADIRMLTKSILAFFRQPESAVLKPVPVPI